MQILLLLILSIVFPNELLAQCQPMTISELVTYNAKDREAVLYAGAKTEGKVTWYTSLAGDSYKGMIKAFESKYAGVKIEAYRTNGGEITNRMVEEAKAKKPIVDTIETTEANLMFQREAFLLRPYHSPYFANYPEDAKVRGESGDSTFGAPRGSPTSVSATIKTCCPKMPCRKITKACFVPRLKAAWVSPSTIPAPK